MGLTGQRKKQVSPHLKNSVVSLGLVLMFSAFGFGLFNLCSHRQQNFEDKLAEMHSLKVQHQQLGEQNQRMRRQVAYLGTNEGIEEVAREKLGLIRPGDLAYAVVPPPPPRFLATQEQSLATSGSEQVTDPELEYDLVVKILRHLFGPAPLAQQVSP